MSYSPPTPDEIRALRGSISQQAFATLLYISRSAIAKMELGKIKMSRPVWELAKLLVKHPVSALPERI